MPLFEDDQVPDVNSGGKLPKSAERKVSSCPLLQNVIRWTHSAFRLVLVEGLQQMRLQRESESFFRTSLLQNQRDTWLQREFVSHHLLDRYPLEHLCPIYDLTRGGHTHSAICRVYIFLQNE
jgi:hypothetical protein